MNFARLVYRTRWIVVMAWLVCAAAMILFVPPADPAANEQSSFLPAHTPYRIAAEANKRMRRPTGQYPSKPDDLTFLVYRRTE